MVVIKGLRETSLIDYPGKVSAVIFLGGCNFQCPYCHNKDITLPKNYEPISEKETLNFLVSRKKWLDGIVVSGGEPTINPNIIDFLKELKKLDYLIKIDTNGTNSKIIKQIIDEHLVDYIAMDIKAPLSKYEEYHRFYEILENISSNRSVREIHQKIIENDKNNVKESIKLIINSEINHEFRSTILPKLHNKEDVELMAKMVQGAKKYYLQQFRPAKGTKMEKEKSFSKKEMEEFRDICRQYVDTDLRL